MTAPHAATLMVGGDPYFASVIFLWHADGTNGATAPFTPTKYAGGSLSGSGTLSSTQKVFGATSLRSTTASGGVGTATGTAMGSGDFTMEGFAYFDSVTALNQVIIDMRPSGVSGVYPLIIAINAELRWSINTVTRISAAGLLTAAAWWYWVVQRFGGVTKMYAGPIAGNTTIPQVGADYTDGNNYLNGDLGIGTSAFAGSYLGGYEDEIRFTSVARYVSGGSALANIPIPTQPFPNY